MTSGLALLEIASRDFSSQGNLFGGNEWRDARIDGGVAPNFPMDAQTYWEMRLQRDAHVQEERPADLLPSIVHIHGHVDINLTDALYVTDFQAAANLSVRHTGLVVLGASSHGINFRAFGATLGTVAVSVNPASTYWAMGHALTSALSAASEMKPEVTAALRILDRWQISDADAARILGFSNSAFIMQLRSAQMGIQGRDREDRLRLFLDIYEGAYSLYRDPHNEVAFLKAAQNRLAGKSVFETMTEGSMLSLVEARDFVNWFNGRS